MMKKFTYGLPAKLGALFTIAMLTAACSDRDERTAGQQNMDQAGERTEQTGQRSAQSGQRTEQLYNDIRAELRDARERGRICASAYEDMREEWSEHTDEMDADRGDRTWREQMSQWGDELSEMFDDMGDIVDRNC